MTVNLHNRVVIAMGAGHALPKRSFKSSRMNSSHTVTRRWPNVAFDHAQQMVVVTLLRREKVDIVVKNTGILERGHFRDVAASANRDRRGPA